MGHKWSLRIMQRWQVVAGLLVPQRLWLSEEEDFLALGVLTPPGSCNLTLEAATTTAVEEMISE